MTVRTFQVTLCDGNGLQAYAWQLPNAQKSILITHGLGEHALRYQTTARFLNALGYSVFAYDLRGHGASQGPRAVLPSGQDLARNGYVHDLAQMFDEVTRLAGHAPLLLGHSLGGLITLRCVAAQLRPVPGAIVTSPALGLKISLIQGLILKYLPSVLPNLGIPNGLDVKQLSHDTRVQADYLADPMVHRRVTPRLAAWMVGAMAQVQAQAAQVNTPVLLLFAGADALVDPAGSRLFVQNAPKQWVQAHEISGAYHELLNETPPWRDPTLKYIEQWLSTQP